MLVRVIPEINPNHASNLFYVKENYLAYAQSPETGNVYRRSGMDARLLHSREFSKKILDDTKITGSNFCIKGFHPSFSGIANFFFIFSRMLKATSSVTSPLGSWYFTKFVGISSKKGEGVHSTVCCIFRRC